MQKNDFKKFAVLMASLAETFGNSIPSEQKIEIYFRALANLTIEQIDKAVITLLNTRTITSTFPVPAEIRDAIGGKLEDMALLALDKLEKTAERYGRFDSVTFDDPVIHMVVVSMGGWPKICRNEEGEEDWTWRRKEFVKLYQMFSRNPHAECPTVLFGIPDIENAAAGRVEWLSKPRIVGDDHKTLEWTQNKIIGEGKNYKALILLTEKIGA